jgi:hypothetical protein
MDEAATFSGALASDGVAAFSRLQVFTERPSGDASRVYEVVGLGVVIPGFETTGRWLYSLRPGSIDFEGVFTADPDADLVAGHNVPELAAGGVRQALGSLGADAQTTVGPVPSGVIVQGVVKLKDQGGPGAPDLQPFVEFTAANDVDYDCGEQSRGGDCGCGGAS